MTTNNREGLNKVGRRRLSDREWNVISKYTHESKLDDILDIAPLPGGFEDDVFIDFEEDKYLSLKEGFAIIKDAIVYPLSDINMSKEEEEIIDSLLEEFTA